jgi:hypothetical protein
MRRAGHVGDNAAVRLWHQMPRGKLDLEVAGIGAEHRNVVEIDDRRIAAFFRSGAAPGAEGGLGLVDIRLPLQKRGDVFYGLAMTLIFSPDDGITLK